MLLFIIAMYLFIGLYHGRAYGDTMWEAIQYTFMWLPNIAIFMFFWFTA